MKKSISIDQEAMNSNFQQEKTRRIYRIGIDARFFNLENKGLGRYTYELVRWLDKLNYQKIKTKKKLSIDNPVNLEYYIFLRQKDWSLFQPKSPNFYKVLADYRWYSWSEQLLFPFLLRKYKLDLVHFPHFNVPLFYRQRFLVTIHDLILFHFPTYQNSRLSKLFYYLKLAAYHLIIRSTVRRAAKIIAISNFTAMDLLESFNLPAAKVKVIYNGVNFEYVDKSGKSNKSAKLAKQSKSQISSICKKYGIIKPYFLYAGSAFPHKNLTRLVKAFKPFSRNYQLVLLGSNDYFYRRLKEIIHREKISGVVITGHLNQKELDLFYRQAKLFIFPSLYEGFGLPPLEALGRKVPVISSDRASLPEVLGDKVRYFNPEKVKDIQRAIKQSLVEPLVIDDLELEKLKKRFVWKKMAQRIQKEYIRLLQKETKNRKEKPCQLSHLTKE